VRQALAEYLTRSTPDYLDGMVTVTGVRISSDLSVARVYVSIWKSKTLPEILVKRMNANQGEFRSVLARELYIRKVPELRFFRDDTLDEAAHIDDLIRKVREEDDRMARARGDLPEENDSVDDGNAQPGELPAEESHDD
jgi:ribosome-binding factor A